MSLHVVFLPTVEAALALLPAIFLRRRHRVRVATRRVRGQHKGVADAGCTVVAALALALVGPRLMRRRRQRRRRRRRGWGRLRSEVFVTMPLLTAIYLGQQASDGVDPLHQGVQLQSDRFITSCSSSANSLGLACRLRCQPGVQALLQFGVQRIQHLGQALGDQHGLVRRRATARGPCSERCGCIDRRQEARGPQARRHEEGDDHQWRRDARRERPAARPAA
mmetsp:Transcript_162597/g.521270  ORF Transcript_162597/g.521270 Transcript_162597/m.521270 type:complete len:222 (+) Transcript_162597:1064-1729(+)